MKLALPLQLALAMSGGALFGLPSLRADSLSTLYSPSHSTGMGVSDNGSILVGSARFSPSLLGDAFRGVGGVGSNLGHFSGGTDSIAHAVSGDGNTIVGMSTGTGGWNRAFRWTTSTGMVDLGAPANKHSQAYGVSTDGSVIVGESSFNNQLRAFRWTAAGGLTNLGSLDGVSSMALGVSTDGTTVVGLSTNGTYLLNGWLTIVSNQAFRWTSAGMVGLGTLGINADGSKYSTALGVSNDGSVVVGSSTTTNAHQRAFRWTSATGMADIGTFGISSEANAVSGDGAFVVGSSELTSNNSRAFLWDAVFGMRDLGSVLTANGVDLAGATLVSANDISGGGLGFSIAGTLSRNGTSQAYVARLDAANIYNFSSDRTVSVSFGGAVPVRISGGADVTLSGSNTYTGGTAILDGTLNVASSQNVGTGGVQIGNGTLKLSADADFGVRSFNLSRESAVIDTNGHQVAIGGDLLGSGVLNKAGEGTLVLTGDAEQSGGIVIHGGAVQIGSGGTTGSVAGNIENNADLIFNRSNGLTFGGTISGSGDVTKLGAGILTFANINTYTGATYVNGGTLTVMGGISGPGGLITVASGATLNGSGTIDREIAVNAGGTLGSSLVLAGQVTLPNQQSVGAVSSGTTTASSGQQVNVTTATGGTINTAAGTASVDTLNGATLNTGNWGATVDNLISGTVNTSGGSLVARQGDFNGTISGTGGLTKTGNGTLTLNTANSYTGNTIVGGGTLVVAAAGATGSASPIRLVNDGKLEAASNVAIEGNIIAESIAATYEKVFGASETLTNFGSLESSLGGRDTTVSIADGTAGAGATVTTQFASSASPGFGFLASDRLTISGLDGTAFVLVMDTILDIPDYASTDEFYLGWFDPFDSTYKNAVLGNHGEDGLYAGGFVSSYQDFIGSHGGLFNSTTMLGAYGVDTVNNKVWAVVDHNSEFSVIPEPSTWVLLSLGVSALVLIRKRKDTESHGS